MNRSILTILVLVALNLQSAAAADDRLRTITVEPQALSSALQDFSDQSGLQIAYVATLAENVTSPGTDDAGSPRLALNDLLDGTGLEHRFINDETVAIGPGNQPGSQEQGAEDPGNSLPTPQRMLMAQVSGTRTQHQANRSGDGTDGSVSGKVSDRRTGAALEGALVRIVETDRRTATDSLGSYRFPGLAPGIYSLEVSYLGFATALTRISLNGGEHVKYPVALGAEGGPMDEIVVFGSRSARALALNQERTADNSSSVVTADLLGNFTGTTLSEALRRVPGIAFQQDAQTGDGSNIIVRGLSPDMNAVKINGLHVPVGSGRQRSANLGNLLADSVGKITIHKTLLPSHDSAGTGALIEVETKSPLARPRRYLNFSVEGGPKARDFSDDLLLSGTVAGTFGSDESFGLSASVQYRDRDVKSIRYDRIFRSGQYLPLETDGSLISSAFQIDPHQAFPYEPGAADSFQSSLTTRYNVAEISNLAVTIAGEWQMGDHTNLKLDMQHAEGERSLFGRSSDFVTSGMSYRELPVVALNGETRRALRWSGGQFTDQDYNLSRGRTDETDTYSLRGVTSRGKLEFTYIAGYAHGSTTTPEDLFLTFGHVDSFGIVNPDFLLASAVDPVEGRVISPFGTYAGGDLSLPLFTEEGFDYFNDPENYNISTGSIFRDKGKNDRYTADFGVKYDVDGEHFKYLEAGVDFETAKYSVRLDSSFVFGFGSIGSFGLDFADSNLSDIGLSGPGFQVVSAADFAAFADGLADTPGIFVDPDDIDAELNQAFTKEDSLAAYIQARFDIGKLEIIGGLRFSEVTVQAVNLESPSFSNEFFQPDREFENQFRRLFDESATASDVLPRVLLNYRKTDNLIFRGGYYKSVARPEIASLSSRRRLALTLAPFFGPDRNQPRLNVQEGNPDLKPAVTHNFDVSAEYYHDQIGALKLGVFYKRVNNLLQTNLTEGIDVLDGLDLPDHPYFQNLPANLFVTGSRPSNDENDATIWGIEGHVERQFTFLPGFWGGFGTYANLTYTQSSRHQLYNWFGSPIFDAAGDLVGRESVEVDFSSEAFSQQPDYSGTFALTYNRNNIDATLAYSAQSRRLSGFGPRNLYPFFDKVETLDLHAEYRFDVGSGSYRVFIEGSDLLKGTNDADIQSFIGGVGGTPSLNTGGTYLGGRAFKMGLSGTF